MLLLAGPIGTIYNFLIILIGCLTARQHRKVNLCGGGKLAPAAKDSQRDTMHNTLRYRITFKKVNIIHFAYGIGIFSWAMA